MSIRLLTALAFTAALAADVNAADFPITDFGARSDGSKCTGAFAAAIDAASRAGGGRIVVPDGRWFTGAIRLRSNCELHLGDGAELVFSQEPSDYLPAVHTTWEGMECWNYCPLVYAYCCTNVAITGRGTLRAFDGDFRESFWKKWVPMDNGIREARRQLYDWGATDHPVEQREIWKLANANTRPQFVQFNRCRDVRWEDFKVRNSPFWTMHLYLCDGVVVRGIDVVSKGENNDGIDIEMTRNVLVENCSFDQGDDTFVIKSGRNRDAWRLHTPTENVEIRNCRFARAHGLCVIGSEISGGVRNVRFHDIHVDRCERLAYIKTNRRRGATLEGISFENVTCGECNYVLAVLTDVLYEWAKFPDYELRTTVIRDIRLRNVHADRAEVRIDVQGDADLPVDGIVLENVTAGHTAADDRLVNAVNVVEDGRPVAVSRQYDITAFGAKSGEDATAAIRAAVAAAAQAGGGRIFFPNGLWPVSGPVELKSNIELNMLSSSELVFSGDPAVYRRADGSYVPMIFAENAENVRFSGGGTVRSDNTPWRSVPAAERPPLVGFRKCRGVHLAGGSFRGAPGRAVEFFDCRRVLMKAIELVLQDETRGFVAAVDSPGAVVSACSYWAGDPLLGIQDPNVRKIRDHHD